jgi:hypothetical protein
VRTWWTCAQQRFRDLKVRDSVISHQEAFVKGNTAKPQWNKTEDVVEEKWIGL